MQYSLSDHSWPSTTINPTVGDGSDINQEYYCNGSNGNRLYVKVYMEGHPIGRKLDILAHHGYHDLITTLDHMFNTNILCKHYAYSSLPLLLIANCKLIN